MDEGLGGQAAQIYVRSNLQANNQHSYSLDNEE
jgi:hypothetical protein